MDPREPRLNRFLDRAAPTFRSLDAAIARNSELRAARDSIADRVADAANQAAEAIKGVGEQRVVEVEVEVADTPGGPSQAAPARVSEPPRSPSVPFAGVGNSGHWTRARVARMAMAASREAVRPQAAPVVDRRIIVAVVSVLSLLLLWKVARPRRY